MRGYLGLAWLALLAGCASLSPGDAAPTWSARDLQGREHSFAEYRGQVVILDFWATWCVPCHPVSDFLQTLREEYDDRDLQILALHYDASGDPAAFARQKGYTFTIFPDGHEVAKLHGVSKIPTLIVVDRSGTVIHRQTGFSADDGAKLKQIVQDAF